jgi:hypothetical protein
MATRVMTAKPNAAGIATSFVEWSPGGTPHALSVTFVEADLRRQQVLNTNNCRYFQG